MRKKLKYFAAACAILIMCTGCNGGDSSEIMENSSSVITNIYSSSLSDNSLNSTGTNKQSTTDSKELSNYSSASSSESIETNDSFFYSTYSNEQSTTENNDIADNYSSASSIESIDTSDHSESEISGEYSGSEPTLSSSSESQIIPERPIEIIDPIQSIISKMSLKEQVYQLFFVRPEQVSGSGYAETSAVDLSDKPVGGIICMGANLKNVEQTKEMLAEMQENAMKNGIGVFFGVDEEGGRVARCAANLGTTKFDNMAVYGARNDSEEAFNIGKTIGGEIGALGFNVDFAPVADVDISPTNELGNRIFSSDPYIVANMVSNVVRGLNYSGVAATLKHFPGLGAENGNSHTATEIIIDRTLDQLRNEEFIPFINGIQAGADFVMVGHQQVTAFGDSLPADLSYVAVTEILRGELGFDGIAITDAQEMNTISGLYYSGTAAAMAINAGIDMILSPEDFDDAVEGVYNAVLSGDIPEERIIESVKRILTIKQKMGLLP